MTSCDKYYVRLDQVSVGMRSLPEEVISEATAERIREVGKKHQRRKGSECPENSMCEGTERSNSPEHLEGAAPCAVCPVLFFPSYILVYEGKEAATRGRQAGVRLEDFHFLWGCGVSQWSFLPQNAHTSSSGLWLCKEPGKK